MANLGVLLILLGIGSFVLPMLGRQFTLMAWVDPYQPFAGIGVALAGVALLFFARQGASNSSPPPAA